MKKILSIVLATLMLLSCFSTTASAEETDLVQLFKNNGIDVEYATSLGAVGDKELCFGSYGMAGDAITNFIIGDYLYCSSDTELGLYIRSGDSVYDLVKAYEQGVVNDEEMGIIYDILNTLKTEQNKDYGIIIYKFDASAEKSLQTRYGNIDFNVMNLCKPTGEAWIYTNIYAGDDRTSVTREIGGYEFRTYNSQTPYDLGIYALYSGKMYTLEEAFEKGYFRSLDLIAEAMNENSYVEYSFGMSEIEGIRGVMLREYPKGTFMMKTLGTIGDYTLYYNDIEPAEAFNYTNYIADYRFVSDARQSSYYLGLYLVSIDRKTVYTLEDAVDDGIVTDMDEVYNMIMARADELDYPFTAEKVIPDTAEKLFALTFDTDSKNLVQLGTVQGYGLYYEDLGTLGEPVECRALLGNYWFYSGQCQMRPSGLNLYIMSDTNAYTLEDAYEQGIITDIDTVYERLRNSGKEFHFSIGILSEAEVVLCKKTNYGYFNLEKIGTIGDYGIYCDTMEQTYLQKVSATLGELRVESDVDRTPYDLGLYVISNDTAYYLEEAYEKGVITDTKALYDILKANEEYYTYRVYYDAVQPTPPIKDEEYTSVTLVENKIKAGETASLFEVLMSKDSKVEFESQNPKVATVTQQGMVTGLKKGTAKITVTANNAKFTCKIKVTTNPKLDKKTITVKKNKTVKVKLTGKVNSIKNVYTNTNKAQIISGKKATTLKVKGLKKGTTTLKIKVNGVKTLKLKVKVV